MKTQARIKQHLITATVNASLAICNYKANRLKKKKKWRNQSHLCYLHRSCKMTCIRSHPHSNNPSEVTILGGKYEKFREIIDCLKVHAPIQPVQVHFCLNDDKAAEQKTQDRERGSVVPEMQYNKQLQC